MDLKDRVNCYSCEEDVQKDTTYLVSGEHTVCTPCADENYVTCDESGELIEKDDARWVDSLDGYVHEDLYYDYYGCCDDCGYTTSQDYLHWDNNGEITLCETCYDNNRPKIDLSDPPSAEYVTQPADTTWKVNKRRRLVGVECEVEELYSIEYGDIIPNWKATSDGSLEDGGIEFVSRPLNGDTLYNSIDSMTNFLRGTSAMLTKRCGLHVHVNALDTYWQELKCILYVARKIEPMLFAMQPKSRRQSNWCKPMELSKGMIDSIHSNDDFIESWYSNGSANTDKYNDTRYHGLNMHARVYLGTIEFRYHTGSMNARKIKCWTEICTSIVDAGIYLSSFYRKKSRELSHKQREIKKIFTSNTDYPINVDIVASLLGLSKQAKQYMVERINKFNGGLDIVLDESTNIVQANV